MIQIELEALDDRMPHICQGSADDATSSRCDTSSRTGKHSFNIPESSSWSGSAAESSQLLLVSPVHKFSSDSSAASGVNLHRDRQTDRQTKAEKHHIVDGCNESQRSTKSTSMSGAESVEYRWRQPCIYSVQICAWRSDLQTHVIVLCVNKATRSKCKPSVSSTLLVRTRTSCVASTRRNVARSVSRAQVYTSFCPSTTGSLRSLLAD